MCTYVRMLGMCDILYLRMVLPKLICKELYLIVLKKIKHLRELSIPKILININ